MSSYFKKLARKPITNAFNSNLKPRQLDIANLIISSQFVLSNNENHFTSVAQKSVLLSAKTNKTKNWFVHIYVVLINSHPFCYSSVMNCYKTTSTKESVNPNHC